MNTTVVIPARAEENWNSLVRAIASARSQSHAPAEVVVVVDHNLALFRRVRRDIGGITVMENAFAAGAEGCRNTGGFYARTSLVAFLDDDAVPATDWLARLTVPFADPAVVGTGGGTSPAWQHSRPRWMPDEFLWAVGDAHAGRPGTRPSSMVVRREVFTAVGGFRLDGDTDLSARMSAVVGGRWASVPAATSRHDVPARRSTFRFFLQRCYAEGRRSRRTEIPLMTALRPGTVFKGGALMAGGVLAGSAAAAYGSVVRSVTDRRTQRIHA